MPVRLSSIVPVCARRRRALPLLVAPLLIVLSGADLYIDAEGRVTQDPAALAREQRFFELRDRADGMRRNPSIAPEQTIAAYQYALTVRGDRDDALRVGILWRMAETYGDAAYASVRAIGRVGEEALLATGGDVEAMLEAMQEVFEAENKGRPNRHYVEKMIAQYEVLAAEAEDIDPLLSARAKMETARGWSNIREFEQSIEIWNEALRAAQARLASNDLDADEREEWERVHLHASTAIPSLEQIMPANRSARTRETERASGSGGDEGLAPADTAPQEMVESHSETDVLEALLTQRAERGFRKESLRVDGNPLAGTAALVPVGGISVEDAIGLIRRAYEVRLCREFDIAVPGGLPPIHFSIHEGQRLVDALDALEEASGGVARWRLLEGRIVVTVRAEHEVDVPGMMDQIVEVFIEESRLMDALLALEASFNEQHRGDIPLILSLNCEWSEEPDRELYWLSGAMTVREAVLRLLAQMDDPSATYSLLRSGGRVNQVSVSISTQPCGRRDAFPIEFEASRERRLQYQQAIDEARAAAEREGAAE